MFFPFIIAVGLAVAGISMGFKQGQANPEANSFFDSQSHISE